VLVQYAPISVTIAKQNFNLVHKHDRRRELLRNGEKRLKMELGFQKKHKLDIQKSIGGKKSLYQTVFYS